MKLILAVAALCLVASAAVANGPVATQIVEFEYDNPEVYIDCVGESVIGHVVGESRAHIFVTPSGTTHILDNWKFKVYHVFSGNRVWIGSGVSPFQQNTKLEKGAVQQWVTRMKFTPVDNDGPAYFYENSFKVTINANGEVVVFNDEIPAIDGFRCLGPNN
jgi:opacity protein-like surface antigen